MIIQDFDCKSLVNAAAPNQPYFFPQLHWWARMNASKNPVILNDVQYTKKAGQVNRGLFTVDGKEKYVTLPLDRDSISGFPPINEVLLAENWSMSETVNILWNYYRKCEWKGDIRTILDQLLEWWSDDGRPRNLNHVLMTSIEIVNWWTGLDIKFTQSSTLLLESNKTQRLLDIAEKTDSKGLILGKEGYQNYFEVSNDPKFDDFTIYLQDWKLPDGIKNYSIFDAIAKYGAKTVKQILDVGK